MRLATITLTILLAVTFTYAQDAAKKPERSAELKVLGKFVGTWDSVSTFKPKEGDAVITKTFETRKWSKGGQVVHFHNPTQPEFHMLMTYDAKTKTYRGVLMVGATSAKVTATWDKKTKTMTFNGTIEDGNTIEYKNRFIDKDNVETTGVHKNAKGEVAFAETIKQTRRKKEK